MFYNEGKILADAHKHFSFNKHYHNEANSPSFSVCLMRTLHFKGNVVTRGLLIFRERPFPTHEAGTIVFKRFTIFERMNYRNIYIT